MEARGEQPLLPANPAPYVTDWLFEIGPGMDGPIGWQEMTAWERLTGIELNPWEARTIRWLSQEYLSERQQARKADSPAPYSGLSDDLEDRREIVVGKIKSAFAGLKGKKG